MTLHFTYEDYVEGLAIITGFIGFNKDSLNIEYQISDNVVGFIKSDIKEVNIPFNSVENLELQKKLFSTKLIVSLSSLKGIGKLPFLKDNTLTFKIKKKHRDKAKEFEVNCNIEISTYKLEQLD